MSLEFETNEKWQQTFELHLAFAGTLCQHKAMVRIEYEFYSFMKSLKLF